MKAPLNLLLYSLKRIRALIAAVGVLLAVFQVFMIVVAGSVQRSNGFEQLNALIPPFARELIGPSFMGLMSFRGMVCIGYFHLSVMGALLAVTVALSTTVTSEIETGLIDLMLARPLARHWIITRSIVVAILSTALLIGMMMFGTWAGLKLLAPANVAWPSLQLILSLAGNLAVLMLCWSGLAMAIGSASRRRGTAGAVAGLLMLFMFLLDYVARSWNPAKSIAWLSPFRYYHPLEMLMGKVLPVSNLVVLASIALGGFLLSYALFSKRDISH